MKILYWCPFIDKVATIKAVLNSAFALNKYSKDKIKTEIINAVGEWNDCDSDEKFEKIDFFKNSKIKYLPHKGFLKSRFTYIVIFFLTLFKLNNLLKKKKPNYLIVHLITSIPLFLFILFKYETKLILRISGYPKLGFFRKIFWKLANKRIFYVTAPTISTLKLLKNSNIFDKDKIIYLPDPVIKIQEIRNKIKEKHIFKREISEKNSLLAIGRLTKQKNFNFLVDAFHELQKKYQNLNLFIAGDGDQMEKLKKQIKNLNMENKIFLIGHQKNIFYYLKNSKAFILSSLWEDPGFVLVEAGYMNRIVLSSDCPNGPKEILNNGQNGFIFKSNSIESFIQNYEKMIHTKRENLLKMQINLKKKCKEFTLYNHYKIFNSIIE